jgi:membrane protease YdiL (CAAX protease family)
MILRSFVERHPVACFFLLAYALSWGAVPWDSFFPPGALIAAVVVVLVTEGPRGLVNLGRRLVRWRVSWVWYALAVGVPLFVHLAATSANAALGQSAPSLSLLTPWYGIPLAVAMHMTSPFGGPLMEEPSFRGFAQVELQKGRSPLAATAIMAVLVTGWHAPLFFMPVFEAPPIGFLTTLAVTFWYAWLLNQASGSSLITLIAHGTEGAVETNSLWGPGADLDRLNIVYAAAWCLVALTLLMLHRRFWTAPPPTEGPVQTRRSSRAAAAVSAGPRNQPASSRPLGSCSGP